jgi:dephospho-CoA kinase
MGERKRRRVIILITGMSGTGKSTLIEALARRGHNAIDLDQPRWSEYRTGDEGQEWMWRDGEVERLLADAPGDAALFVSGCASNQVNFYDRIDEIVLLTAPLAVMLERVATRTTSSYGKSDDDIAAIIENHREVEPLLRKRATLVLDTTVPVDALADAVLAHCGASH